MPRLLPAEEIAAKIRQLRGNSSLAAFAARAGKPGQGPQFGKYEAGKIPPSLETLEAIAAAANVPMSVFYREGITAAEPLSTGDIVALRERMRAIRAEADEVLAVLEEALGRQTPAAPVAPAEAYVLADERVAALTKRERARRRS